nr:hypothetical protein CFP56_56003 [Quercus suber]
MQSDLAIGLMITSEEHKEDQVDRCEAASSDTSNGIAGDSDEAEVGSGQQMHGFAARLMARMHGSGELCACSVVLLRLALVSNGRARSQDPGAGMGWDLMGIMGYDIRP